jgi:hypothetical protein
LKNKLTVPGQVEEQQTVISEQGAAISPDKTIAEEIEPPIIETEKPDWFRSEQRRVLRSGRSIRNGASCPGFKNSVDGIYSITLRHSVGKWPVQIKVRVFQNPGRSV